MKQVKSCLCCNSKNVSKSPAIIMPFITHRIFGYEITSIDNSWNLHNFPTGICLSQCFSSQCQDCGFLFLDMRFDDEEMSNLYQDYRGEDYSIIRDKFEPGYLEKNKQIESGIKYKHDIELFLSDLAEYKTILDWGGDDGINTPSFDADRVFIYDISGKKVLPNFQSIESDELNSNDYDLVICSNVLEHVSYPQEILSEIVSVMNKETILYIEVPYEKIMADSFDSKNIFSNKRHWHEHINFYSQKSLEELLDKCGLKIVKQKIHSDSINTSVSNVSKLFMIACKLSFQN